MWGRLAVPPCQTSLMSCRTPEGVHPSLKGYWSAFFTSSQAPHLSSHLPLSSAQQPEQVTLRSQAFSQSLGGTGRGQRRGKEKMLAWVKMDDCRDDKRHPTTWDSEKDNEKNWSGWKAWGNKRPCCHKSLPNLPCPKNALSPAHASVPLSAARRPPPLVQQPKGPYGHFSTLPALENLQFIPVPPCLPLCDLHNPLILPHLYLFPSLLLRSLQPLFVISST